MMTPPRVFMGVNNIEFKNRLLSVYLRDSELSLYKNKLPDIEMAAQMTLNQEDELMSEKEESGDEEGCASAFYNLLGMQPSKRKRQDSAESHEGPVRNLYNIDPADFRQMPTPQPTGSTLTINDIMRGGHRGNTTEAIQVIHKYRYGQNTDDKV
ncbi:hypothetical protein DPMN_092565 [Dreissena polymorpha]|uniref:Uncharacterized protein n=1 Tax=Dreissena polymorpha TaxID=45954 RepID=A0A9D4L2N1_DREPO|nr:hypothetical protein DPMN_092565 [Dreissena polymorpha]